MAVARAHGLEAKRPRVVRDLSNVLVHLAPAAVIARVATSTAAVRPDGARAWLARDLELAGFLAARGAAVVRPADELPPGPHDHDGLVLTFWRLVEPAAERPPPAAAGRALRALHAHLESFPGAQPALASVLDEAALLASRQGLPELERPLEQARAAIEAAALPARPLHGDSHVGNLLDTPSGLLWTDFEDSCAGPLEWDLGCLTATSPDPAAALRAYGYEGGAEALAPFVEARLIQTAAWTAQLATDHPHLRARVQERLARWRVD